MENMCIGIVGLCHSHPFTFARILQEEFNVKLPYVYDGNEKEVENFIKKFGSQPLESPEEFLEKGLQGVLITTRTNRHFETAKIFLEAGIPVFIDKPMAMNPEEAQEIVELARKNNAIMLSSSALRYAPSFDVLIQKTRSGELGVPLTAMVNVFYGIHVEYQNNPDDWQLTEEEASGIIYNYGIHCVEPLIAALGPKVESVKCVSNSVNLPAPFNDVTIITIEFEGGAVGVGRLIGSTTLGGYQMEVHGTKASLSAPTMTHYGPYGEEAKEFGATSTHGYSPMMKEFLQCIEQKKNRLPWEETLAVIEVLEKAKSSTKIKKG